MLGRTFKSRALVEGRRYAKDRMVYLREFCQNARDAGAAEIRVSTQRAARYLKIIFDDNGQGMSFDHAKSYLFTLYASSKEQESDSAGRFGVGFWSVLLSTPITITVASKPKTGPAWKIRMDGDLQSLGKEPPNIKQTGTRIVVTYQVRNDAESDRLEMDAEAALNKYCCYLRQNDKAKSPLPVWFNTTRIDRPFKLESPCWMTFSGKHIEGAVGLTETPGVEIYAQGLPVWQGTVIEELQYGAKRQTPVHLPKGLAPYYLINGHNLNVTYDRRAIIDDRALKILRRSARVKMDELLRRYLDQVSPRPFHVRFFDSIRRGIVSMFIEHKLASIGILMLLAAALTFRLMPSAAGPAESRTRLILNESSGARPSAEVERRSLGNPMVYNGPTTELPLFGSQLSLVYLPKTDQAFRIAAMETLDDTVGILANPPRIEGPYPDFSCGDACMHIAVSLDANKGLAILPTPSGHKVVPGSVKLDSRPVPLYVSSQAEPVIKLNGPTKGALSYSTGPAPPTLTSSRRDALLQLPRDASLPTELERVIARIKKTDDKERQIAESIEYIESRIAYDASPTVSRRYDGFRRKPPPKAWMTFVFSLGRGDCDVKNTLLVYLLRSLGIPARLAVGPIGEKGEVKPLMHAWVEFFHDAWRVADATGGAGAADTLHPDPPMEIVNSELAPDNASPTPSAEAETAGDAAESEETFVPSLHIPNPSDTLDRNQISGIVFSIAMIAGTLLILSTLFLSGRSGRIVMPESSVHQEEVAAKIAAGALAFPEWWHLGDGFKKRAILPTFRSGRNISIAKAEQLAEKGALFVAEKVTPLLSEALKAGVCVLDGASEILRQVASLLPSITHLDEIERLAPTSPSEMASTFPIASAIADGVNLIIKKSGISNVEVYLTTSAMPGTVRELNLAPIGRTPGHLIVLSCHDSVFSKHNHDRPPSLRIYEAVDAVSKRSDFLFSHRARLLKTAAEEIWRTDA